MTNGVRIRNSQQAWGVVHQAIHWIVVVAVLSQLALGFIFADLPNGPRKSAMFAAHATLGVSILLLMLTRFVWRQLNPVPELPPTLTPSQKKLALVNHWAFYLLLIGLPLGGYLLVNAKGFAVPFFGIKLPADLAKSEGLADAIFVIHAGGAFLLIALIVLHVTAALRHEFLLKDNVLRRMTPLAMRGSEPAEEPALQRGRGRPGH